MNTYIMDWLAARTESEDTERQYIGNIEIFAEFSERREFDFSRVVDEWRRVKRAGIDEREEFLDLWADLVRSFNTWIKKRYAPLTVKNLLSTVKSYFSFWDIPVKVVLPKRACVIYHNRDLTKEEVRQILTFASPRDRVIWLVMAESGMRAKTCVHMKYWQIKEDFEAGRVPMTVLLPSSSLKDHVGDRWTFIGEDSYYELKEYLAKRIPLDDEDYVFISEKPGKVKGDQFSTASLSVKFARVVCKLGLTKSREGKPKRVRLHSLRKFFRNNMRAESGFKKFWMGHSLGVDAHYISRNLEKHRNEYTDGYRYLRIFEPSLESLADLTEQLRKRDIEIQRLKARLNGYDNYLREQMEKTLKERLEMITFEKTTALEKLLKRVEDLEKKLAEK